MAPEDKLEALTKQWADAIAEDFERIQATTHDEMGRFDEYCLLICEFTTEPERLMCSRALLELGANEQEVMDAINKVCENLMVWRKD